LIAPTQVGLSWTDGSSDDTGFEIYRREGVGLWTWIATIASGSPRFADLNVHPSTTYTYRVRARNDRGVSDWSNEATVTTLSGP
jgi:large repetitive protein